MIQFKDNADKTILEISYITRISSTKIYIDFNIDKISPELNGETLYLTTDEIGEPAFMYKIKGEFEFVDLNYEATSVKESYAIIGEFIEKIRYAILTYKGGDQLQSKPVSKKKKKLNKLEV